MHARMEPSALEGGHGVLRASRNEQDIGLARRRLGRLRRVSSSNPASASISSQKRSRRSRFGLKTMPRRADRTAANASSCVRASTPDPITPTVSIRSGARCGERHTGRCAGSQRCDAVPVDQSEQISGREVIQLHRVADTLARGEVKFVIAEDPPRWQRSRGDPDPAVREHEVARGPVITAPAVSSAKAVARASIAPRIVTRLRTSRSEE